MLVSTRIPRPMVRLSVLLICSLSIGACSAHRGAASGETSKNAPHEKAAAIHELPDPFRSADGSLVATPKDWTARRAEIQSLIQEFEYGHLPARPEVLEVLREAPAEDAAAGIVRQNLRVRMEHDGKRFELPVALVIPSKANGKVPVLVRGVTKFNAPPPAGQPLPDDVGMWIARGYAVAEFEFPAVAADRKEPPKAGGLYDLYGETDCGVLMAWAWGFSRAIDGVVTVPGIDASKIAVTGHSRYGKAALLAGAFDERIALTAPSHSGAAGTAPYTIVYGDSETLEKIVAYAPHWFTPKFSRFIGHVDKMTFDQNLVRALVAPRGQLSTEGLQDRWANPQGSQIAYLSAKKVYEFLGAPDKISIRFRPVAHITTDQDVLEFADYLFFNRPLSPEFGKLAC